MSAGGELKDVNVVEVIEVLSIESAKYEQTASQKGSTVPPSGPRKFSMHFHALQGLSLGVEDKDVLEVTAETPTEDVQLPLEKRRWMTPTW